MQSWLAGRWHSFGYALAGIVHVLRTQPNFHVHLVATVLVTLSAVVLQVSPVEGAVLALTIGLVLAAEAVNTAIESTVDALGGPPSTPARYAKDAAAGAVLLAAIAAVVVGVLVLGPRLVARLTGG